MYYTNISMSTKRSEKEVAQNETYHPFPCDARDTTEIRINLEILAKMTSGDEGAEKTTFEEVERIVCKRSSTGTGGEVVYRG